MTPDEAVDLAVAIQEEWSSFPVDLQATATALEREMRNVSKDAALAAMHAFAASPANRGHVPTAGQILRKAAELSVAPPAWDEVRRQLAERVRSYDRAKIDPDGPRAQAFRWTCPDRRCDGTGWIVVDREAARCGCFDRLVAARRGLDRVDPMVRTWIEQGFVTWDRVRAMLGGDLTADAQVRRDWEAYAGRAIENRVLTATSETGGLRRLEQAHAAEAGAVTARRGPRALGAAPADGDALLTTAGLAREPAR